MTQPTQNKLNGTQRIEALERTIANMSARHDQQMEIVANEINRLNEFITALAKRINAIIKAGETDAGLNEDSVKNVMVNEAAKELKARVDMLKDQGVLLLNNDKVIDDDTFVVGREENSEGKEINPRTQFLVKALAPEAKTQILGKKVGDAIKNEETQQVLFITETYDIVQPKPQAVVEESSEPAESTEAPAAGAEVMRTKTKRAKKA